MNGRFPPLLRLPHLIDDVALVAAIAAEHPQELTFAHQVGKGDGAGHFPSPWATLLRATAYHEDQKALLDAHTTPTARHPRVGLSTIDERFPTRPRGK